MRKTALIILILVTLCYLAIAVPTRANLEGARLGPDSEFYNSLLNDGIKHGFPGFILGVSENNKRAWIGAAGVSNIERGFRMKPNDRFHIASITKIFTATAILKMVDEGKLSLDTKVVNLLSRKLLSPIPYIDEITVFQLLDHSSGIYGFNNDQEYIDTWVGPRVNERFDWTPEKLVALAYGNRVKPFGKPGTGNFYGDTNYVLLGMIVEKVSGMPLRQYVKKKIFDPLNLKNSAFFGEKINSKLIELPVTTQGYLKRSKVLDSVVKLDSSFKSVKKDLVNTTKAGEKIDAAASIVSTAGDLLKFARALYSGKLLSTKSMKILLSAADGIEKESVGTEKQSITSIYRESYGILFASTGDGPGGINAILAYHPKTDIIIVGFTNIFGMFDEADFIKNHVIKKIILEKQKQTTSK